MEKLGIILDWLLIFRRVRKLEADVATLQAELATVKTRMEAARLEI